MRGHLAILFALALSTGMMWGQSPYISRVFSYEPAPGQFIGDHYPDIFPGDTYDQVLTRVDSILVGAQGEFSSLVCLGAWGGQVTFGFDHPIVNLAGKNDLIVYGNAFYSGQPQNGYQYGSAEPGIIYVSRDDNGNGLPDDTWYEIAGSEYSRTTHHYEVTYYYSTDSIRWTDNLGGEGYVRRNAFHQQATYYPCWRTDKQFTLSGALLPENLSTDGNKRAFCYDFGYADNHPNDSASAQINLEWAVDANGEPANLDRIHFVRVQSGVLADWGISGEVSTEVTGAADLHPSATGLTVSPADSKACKQLRNGQLYILRGNAVYSVTGVRIQ